VQEMTNVIISETGHFAASCHNSLLVSNLQRGQEDHARRDKNLKITKTSKRRGKNENQMNE
jgi:hypothetical protein